MKFKRKFIKLLYLTKKNHQMKETNMKNRINLFMISILVLLAASCASSAMQPDVEIKVDISHVRHTIRGGMGASWHAISKDFPLENEKYKYPSRT